MITDWTDAYANAPHIPGGADYPASWERAAAMFRARWEALSQLDIAYGEMPRQKLDLFLPAGAAKGLAVFVHGGFWANFDRKTWSHWAEGAVLAGWAVAMPSYTLAPEARLSAITVEIAHAIQNAAGRISGPIRLAGHSAGGHLVTRMITRDTRLPPDILGRIQHVLSISGVHDLRPLLRAAMNAKLCLDLPEARAESPSLLEPLEGVPVTAWVGGAERPEFLRQSRLIVENWAGFEVPLRHVVEEARHHFDVCAALTAPDSPLTRCWLETAAGGE